MQAAISLHFFKTFKHTSFMQQKHRKTNKFYLIGSRFILMLLIFFISFLAASCKYIPNKNNGVQNNSGYDFGVVGELQAFKRAAMDFSSVKFTPWNVEAASAGIEGRAQKPYTIMIYMNGSDLESSGGAATADLIEMLSSGLRAENANLVVFTGGAKQWLNNVVPSNTCVVWEIADGYIYKKADIGLKDMGDPGTLSGFIDFTIKNFPADKYGLIFWDHGGGSIAGFGSDEKFNKSNLSLLDLNCAFEKSGLKNNKLEFLGFDACLMAAVEMGVVAENYANYLIASEDLEPGDGWDYSFLSVLNNNPRAGGAEIGKAIVDYFINFYGTKFYGDLTLSVIDLKNINKVMHSMGELMSLCLNSLNEGKAASFNDLSKKRYATKTFGGGSPLNNAIDMVDVGDMAEKLKDKYPDEAYKALTAINSAVVYNRHNSDAKLSGISTYYVYGGKTTGNKSLNVYSGLKMDEAYTEYLHSFFGALTGRSIFEAEVQTRNSAAQNEEIIGTDLTLWKKDESGLYLMAGIIKDFNNKEDINSLLFPQINGYDICMFEISSSSRGKTFSVPVSWNGENAELIILANHEFPNGKILGMRKDEGFIIQKGYDDIKTGDALSFYYKIKSFASNGSEAERGIEAWYKSSEFTVDGELQIEWAQAGDNAFYSMVLTDVHNNKTFGELKQLELSGRAAA